MHGARAWQKALQWARSRRGVPLGPSSGLNHHHRLHGQSLILNGVCRASQGAEEAGTSSGIRCNFREEIPYIRST